MVFLMFFLPFDVKHCLLFLPVGFAVGNYLIEKKGAYKEVQEPKL